jgi:hypothetical protein
VLVSRSRQVALLCEKPCPAWVWPWLPRFLRIAGCLRSNEQVLVLESMGALVAMRSAAAPASGSRTRFALRGRLRHEFVPGAFVRFRARSIREAMDFAQLKANAAGRNS